MLHQLYLRVGLRHRLSKTDTPQGAIR
jgi:hypothetical protein